MKARVSTALIATLTVATLLGGALYAQNAATGKIRTIIKPSSAGVFIDGKYMGPAGGPAFARQYRIPAGTHELTLREPRYREVTQQVLITAGKMLTVSEEMAPVPLSPPPHGSLRITGGDDADAAVYIDDQFMGHLDAFNSPVQGLLLKPNTYQLRVESRAGEVYEQEVRINAEQTTHVELR